MALKDIALAAYELHSFLWQGRILSGLPVCRNYSFTSGKEPACQCRRHRDVGWIPGLRRSQIRKWGTAAHSSILAWRISWTEESGLLQSIGLQSVGHDWSSWACTLRQRWWALKGEGLGWVTADAVWKINSMCIFYNANSLACQFSSVQLLSPVQLLQPHWLQHARPPLSVTNFQSLLKLVSIELMMPSSHLILCHPLLLPPSLFPCIRVFSSESVLIRWPKYWSFSFSISPSSEYSGLISFRMNWLDLLAVQGTLKSLLQYHGSKASILWCSAFFIVKTIVLTRWIFVGKVMSLLFNMLSRLVITFLPRSKCLLISWLQSPSAVILEPLKNKVWHCFHRFPIYFPWSDGTSCHDLRFLNVEL